MTDKPAISIIILTSNRPGYLQDCLASIEKQGIPNCEVIIIDNSEKDDTEKCVQKIGKESRNLDIEYISTPSVLNIFPAGRNIGLEEAESDIIAFFDDDVVLDEGWIRTCLSTFTSRRIGAVGGRIVEPYSRNLDPREQKRVGKILKNGAQVGNFYIDPGRIIEIDQIRGCAWACRKEVLLKVNGFDPLQVLYEETDACVRIRKAGYKILFNPKMSVFHRCAPRNDIFRKRDPSRYLVQNRAALKYRTYMLLKNFGVKSPIFWRFLFTHETALMAFFKHPSLYDLVDICNKFAGKTNGILYLYSSLIKRTPSAANGRPRYQ